MSSSDRSSLHSASQYYPAVLHHLEEDIPLPTTLPRNAKPPNFSSESVPAVPALPADAAGPAPGPLTEAARLQTASSHGRTSMVVDKLFRVVERRIYSSRNSSNEEVDGSTAPSSNSSLRMEFETLYERIAKDLRRKDAAQSVRSKASNPSETSRRNRLSAFFFPDKAMGSRSLQPMAELPEDELARAESQSEVEADPNRLRTVFFVGFLFPPVWFVASCSSHNTSWRLYSRWAAALTILAVIAIVLLVYFLVLRKN
ncbi:uncharacterized protein BJ171DRAFT_586275 [Polychytrium aggregatum]|uniref:uncharacterized protein n=1 Tax=Polychytrium aggregatum TaxID=110093 RepID=UPI0022FEB4F8|nr:uncharacterized protein BJ171DRAFT_586275 [Polychytrium aggregatum]KAI9197147.1 hypothetical protein BJ171DRAFT_586275 [Polychytrium aggregatum]